MKTVSKKYKDILSHEKKLSRKISNYLVEFPQMTVWEVLIPILFILKFANFKEKRESFVLNHMFTKELALKAARDMQQGLDKTAAKKRIEEKTTHLIDTAKNGIYSEKIKQKQMAEIDILINHYDRLFKTDGSCFKQYVRNAYGQKKRFELFLEKLKQAEKETTQAAIQTLGEKSDKKMASRIEGATEKVRKANAESIFSDP